jgi:hypothetical protein
MSFLSNLGKYNNKLIFCTKIFVKNESQETDIYVGENCIPNALYLFTSTVFKQVMQELGIKHHTSSAYYPAPQGAL